MNEYKNVGTPGHVDYVEVIRERDGRVVIIDNDGMRYAELSDLRSLCPTGHEGFFDKLKTPVLPRPQNRETWRGSGKRRMPKRG